MKINVFGRELPFFFWYSRESERFGEAPPQGYGMVFRDYARGARLLAPWPFSFVLRLFFELYWRTAYPTENSRERYVKQKCIDYHARMLDEYDSMPKWGRQ